jgi:hypothetical protein
MATKKIAEKTKARVLLDCAYGKVDEVIEIAPVDLATAIASGNVDPHPDAVAHAEALKAAAEELAKAE